ncbi:MAG: calcium/sodium antiporter [bacterium]|nr:calcium/sodium antiporter [bacterium]
MLPDVLLILAGLAALFVGGDSLVKGAARLASTLGISPLVVGLTVVAFGTSVPELLVSINAASAGVSDIALGNVLGSNITNIGLILGVSALIFPITVEWRLIRQEIPLMIIVSVVVLAMARDGVISQADGLLLVVGFVSFTVVSLVLASRSRIVKQDIHEFSEQEHITPAAQINTVREALRLVAGIVLLGVGAGWTVDGATAVARSMGISEFIIGVTLVAFGTSLPELVASVIAAMRRESDIAIGNVVGSNIANLLAILGITASLHPIPVASNLLIFEFPVMIAFALLLVPFVLRRQVLRRPAAVLLFTSYVGFIAATILR